MSGSGGSVGTDILLAIPPDYFTVRTEGSEGIENDENFSDGVYILNDLLSENVRDSFKSTNLLLLNSSLTTKNGANKTIPQDDIINKSYVHNYVRKSNHERATESTHKIKLSSSCKISKGRYPFSIPGSPSGTTKFNMRGSDDFASSRNSEDLQNFAPILEITSNDNTGTNRTYAIMNDSNHLVAGHSMSIKTINDDNMKQELFKEVRKNSDEAQKQDTKRNTPIAMGEKIAEDNYIMMKFLNDEMQRINSINLDNESQTSDCLKYDLQEADSLQKKMENARLQVEETLNSLEKKAHTENDAYKNDLTWQSRDSISLLGDLDITRMTTQYSSPTTQPADYIPQFHSGGNKGAEGRNLSAIITEPSVFHKSDNNYPNEKWNSNGLQGLFHTWAKDVATNTEDISVPKQKLEEEPYRRQMSLIERLEKFTEIFSFTEKRLLQDAYEELKKTQKHVSELETELTDIREQKDMITTKFMEEQKRVSVLEQQNSIMEQALRLAKRREKSANEESQNYEERLKAARNEIRLCCQSQLQTIIKEKAQEFEEKLAAAKAILKAELETSKTQLLKNANNQCKMFVDRHKREITKINEEFRKEMKEMELKLADSEHKRITAEKLLKEETNRRIEAAERLRSVMEEQWKETLKIITDANSGENKKSNPYNNNNNISETTEKRIDKSYEMGRGDSSQERSSSSATFYDDDIIPIRKLNTDHTNDNVLNNNINLIGLNKPRLSTSTCGTVDVPFTTEVATTYRLANTEEERVPPDFKRNTHMLLETPPEIGNKSGNNMRQKCIGNAKHTDVQNLKWEELLKRGSHNKMNDNKGGVHGIVNNENNKRRPWKEVFEKERN